MSSQYVDKEIYLGDTFSSADVANQMLRSTSTAQDVRIDVNPSIKKLGYELAEVDSEIDSVTQKNMPELLDHALRLNVLQTQLGKLDPDFENVNTELSKLEREFLVPFEKAKQAHTAFRRLAATAGLVRALNLYLHLAIQIDGESEGLRASSEDIYSSSRSYTQIKSLLATNQDLMGIQVVRTHSTSLDASRTKLLDRAIATIKEHPGDLNDLRFAVLTIENLEGDLSSVAAGRLRSEIDASVSQLSKGASGTPATFESAFRDALQRSVHLKAFKDTLKQNGLASKLPQTTGDADIVDHYWAQVSTGLNQKLKTVRVANPQTARSMSTNSSKILKITESVPQVLATFQAHFNANSAGSS